MDYNDNQTNTNNVHAAFHLHAGNARYKKLNER